jgi:spore coat polysaccharide biosynthesis protein SpsF (cytidylyltransferase family)
MLSTLGVVDVHALAGHPLAARRLGNCSLMEWVVRRVSEAQLLERVLVLMDDEREHQRVGRLLPPHVLRYDTPHADPLARMAAAAVEHQADAVVHVDIGHPFIDPVLLDRLVSTAVAAPKADYISYCLSDGRPAILSRLGVFGQWCRTDALVRADHEAQDPRQRRDVFAHVRSHPERFSMRLIPVPPSLDRPDLRLAINGQEDWHQAEMIFEALGSEGLDWQRITGLLDQQAESREYLATQEHGKSQVG